MRTTTSPYPTIRQAAAMPECPYTEYAMRLMLARNELPGFYSGTRYRINYALLMEQVEAESRSRMKEIKPGS